MLIFDFYKIGNNLLSVRKRRGMTQVEVAEAAGLSDRTYADIERGTVNMRVESLLRICSVLQITPDEILTEDNRTADAMLEEIIQTLNTCQQKEKQTALRLLDVYLRSQG